MSLKTKERKTESNKVVTISLLLRQLKYPINILRTTLMTVIRPPHPTKAHTTCL